MKRCFVLFCLPILVAAGPDAERYDACIALVRQNAAAAFTEGLDWTDQGGGVAARHCTAMALSAMGKDEAAADTFLEAAMSAANGQGIQLAQMQMTPQLLAQLFVQAGNSYILAGQPEAAIDPFTLALNQLILESPAAASVYTDRARSYALTGDYKTAYADLTAALAITPRAQEALLYRAAAARKLENYESARIDLINLIALRPDRADAYLEQGQLALASGDDELALKSLKRVLELEEDGPVAEAAQSLLAQTVSKD